MAKEWYMLFFVWAVVEFIQFLRKKPFPQRMKTGAWWGVFFVTLTLYGGTPQEQATLPALGVFFAMSGAFALVIYGIRLAIAKGWARLLSKRNVAEKLGN